MDNHYKHIINKFHRRFLEKRFKELNIGRAEAPYINMIHHHSPIKMNTLISNVIFHKSHTTRAINQMVKDGLIIKEKDQEDKRSYIITITDKGIQVAESVEQILKEWESLLNNALTESEREQLEIMRKKVYLDLKAYFEEDNSHETDV